VIDPFSSGWLNTNSISISVFSLILT